MVVDAICYSIHAVNLRMAAGTFCKQLCPQHRVRGNQHCNCNVLHNASECPDTDLRHTNPQTLQNEHGCDLCDDALQLP